MYGAIRRYKLRPGALDEFRRRDPQSNFEAMVDDIPGYVAYYGIVLGPDEVATVSIFENEAGEEESTRRAGQWIRDNVAHLFAGPPEVWAGEIEWSGQPAMVGAMR